MSDIRNWFLGILGTLLVASVLGWLSLKTRVDLYERVIPSPVENALRELREKTNGQAENCNKAQGVVSNNTTEISNLKERVTRLENKPNK